MDSTKARMSFSYYWLVQFYLSVAEWIITFSDALCNYVRPSNRVDKSRIFDLSNDELKGSQTEASVHTHCFIRYENLMFLVSSNKGKRWLDFFVRPE